MSLAAAFRKYVLGIDVELKRLWELFLIIETLINPEDSFQHLSMLKAPKNASYIVVVLDLTLVTPITVIATGLGFIRPSIPSNILMPPSSGKSCFIQSLSYPATSHRHHFPISNNQSWLLAVLSMIPRALYPPTDVAIPLMVPTRDPVRSDIRDSPRRTVHLHDGDIASLESEGRLMRF
jgi:hypothetical protein